MKDKIIKKLKELFHTEISYIALIELKYTYYNGFVFSLLSLEIGGFEGDLFSINFGNDFLTIGLLFFLFEIKSPLT